MLVAVALSTTAIGTLLPILREAGELETRFGRFVLGAGAIGEFAPIVLFSLIITGDDGVAVRSGLLATFVFIACACAVVALRLRPPHIIALLSRELQSTSQLPIRLSMVLLGGLVVLADVLGLDILLGAFAAGSLVGLVARGPGAEPFRQKLDALGFGFLIPIFFVMSGAQIDLPALFASSRSMARVPLFLALFLVVRGLPVLLYRGMLSGRERWELALFSATTLPLIVVIAELGQGDGADAARERGGAGRGRHPVGADLSAGGSVTPDAHPSTRLRLTGVRPGAGVTVATRAAAAHWDAAAGRRSASVPRARPRSPSRRSPGNATRRTTRASHPASRRRGRATPSPP